MVDLVIPQESLHDGLEYLRATFRQNSYSNHQIQQFLNTPERVVPEKSVSVAFLPSVSTTFNRISRLLSRHNIESVGLL
jgi:hypothetical protein